MVPSDPAAVFLAARGHSLRRPSNKGSLFLKTANSFVTSTRTQLRAELTQQPNGISAGALSAVNGSGLGEAPWRHGGGRQTFPIAPSGRSSVQQAA
jgi:hypothetical protein